jgi:8-oxo-dGTP diphosphatase
MVNGHCSFFRSGALIINDNKILLIYRKKKDKEYFVFPGGSIENEEKIEAASIRELFEETSVIASQSGILYCLHIKKKTCDEGLGMCKSEFIVKCNYISGTPFLSKDSEEYSRMDEGNIYKPLWVSIGKIKELLLYPLEIRDLLIKDLSVGFSSITKKIEISFSDLRTE